MVKEFLFFRLEAIQKKWKFRSGQNCYKSERITQNSLLILQEERRFVDVTTLLSSPVRRFSKGSANHVGKKSIQEIYELLDNVDLYWSRQYGWHLASYKNVQTITSLSVRWPTETTLSWWGGACSRTSCFPCQPSEKCGSSNVILILLSSYLFCC